MGSINPPFIKVSGRVEIMASALSGSGNLGNYNPITEVKVVLNEGGKVTIYDVPAISGNEVKHFHAVYLAEDYVAMGGKLLNEFCKRGIGLRGYKHDAPINATDDNYANNEAEAIIDLCNDIHGFLITDKQIKRDSLVKASFMIPVLTKENLENTVKYAVTHNRVDPRPGQRTDQKTAMMVFKNEYATGPSYGFLLSMDLGWVLTPMYSQDSVELSKNEEKNKENEKKKDEKEEDEEKKKEKKLRIIASLTALHKLITGSGSKQSRALPITKIQEIVLAVSNVPIPNLVHGAYPNYCKESLEILRSYIESIRKVNNNANNAKVNVLIYGIKECGEEKSDVLSVESVNELKDLFDKAINYALEYAGLKDTR